MTTVIIYLHPTLPTILIYFKYYVFEWNYVWVEIIYCFQANSNNILVNFSCLTLDNVVIVYKQVILIYNYYKLYSAVSEGIGQQYYY